VAFALLCLRMFAEIVKERCIWLVARPIIADTVGLRALARRADGQPSSS
jgi:hypothetical protein